MKFTNDCKHLISASGDRWETVLYVDSLEYTQENPAFRILKVAVFAKKKTPTKNVLVLYSKSDL